MLAGAAAEAMDVDCGRDGGHNVDVDGARPAMHVDRGYDNALDVERDGSRASSSNASASLHPILPRPTVSLSVDAMDDGVHDETSSALTIAQVCV